jgi:hypothetical protein
VSARLEPTLALSVCTIVLAVLVSIPLGVLAAKRGTWIDRVVMGFSVLGSLEGGPTCAGIEEMQPALTALSSRHDPADQCPGPFWCDGLQEWTGMEAAINGAYLWQLTVPRWNSTIGLVLFATVSGTLLGILAAHRGALESMFATVVLWLVALAALWGAYTFGRWVLWPPLALAVTEAGLTTFLQVDKGDYRPPGVLVAWSDIESLSHEMYVSSRRRQHALVVHLRPGHSSIPVDKISLKREQNALYWQIWSAAMGQRVASELTPFLQRFGASRR